MFTLGERGECAMLGRFGQNIKPTEINGFLETHQQSLGLSSHDDIYSMETVDVSNDATFKTIYAKSDQSEVFGSPRPLSRKPRGRIVMLDQENDPDLLKNATNKTQGKAARAMRNERVEMLALDLIPFVNIKLNPK